MKFYKKSLIKLYIKFYTGSLIKANTSKTVYNINTINYKKINIIKIIITAAAAEIIKLN